MNELFALFLYFVMVSLLATFLLGFNLKITESSLAKRLTWYLMWTSVFAMIYTIVVMWYRIKELY